MTEHRYYEFTRGQERRVMAYPAQADVQVPGGWLFVDSLKGEPWVCTREVTQDEYEAWLGAEVAQ